MTKKTRQLKVGDPVLWYGFSLAVTEIVKKGDTTVASVENVAAAEQIEAARKEIGKIREKQATLRGDAHDTAHERIAELDANARQAIVRVKLRVDLLSWWEERAVWVSDGRILSDTQIEAWRASTGSSKGPPPSAQRTALTYLEAQGRT